MKNKKGNAIIIGAIVIVVLLVVAGVAWIVGSRMQRMQLPAKQEASQKLTFQSDKDIYKTITEGVVYKFGNNIIFYNPKNQEEKIIFSSDKLIDFDISKDGKYLAYSLIENGFSGNSDIYFFDIVNQKTIRLTEKNNIASSSPKIYADGKRVAYLRRTFDTKMGKLRDGEIWTIDTNGDVNTSAKLFGDESRSWFELDPKSRCCVCDKNEKLYEPENMLTLESISEDGNFVDYKQGNFGLMCFAGFYMQTGVYNTEKKEILGDIKILFSKDSEYYEKMYSKSPSDPYPFCIKNTFFDKNEKLVWEPEKGILDDCQHDYYCKPLDFQINQENVNMVYLANDNKLYEANFSTNLGMKEQFEKSTLLYEPQTYYNENGVVSYTDNILDAKKIGNFVVFLEKKEELAYPVLNIMDTSNKKIQKTINLKNGQKFSIVSVN